jgi:hypothetical protein
MEGNTSSTCNFPSSIAFKIEFASCWYFGVAENSSNEMSLYTGLDFILQTISNLHKPFEYRAIETFKKNHDCA